MTASRWLQVAHRLPERTRLYTPVLRRDDDACERAADAIAALDGVRDVRVRPYTGSVVVAHDRALAVATLVDTLRGALAIDRVLRPGERAPFDPDVPAMSSLARTLIAIIRELDRDVRRATDGAVDIGTVMTFSFFGAGALDFAATRELRLPPWFQLAWWGFRTFTTTEQEEIRAEVDGDRARATR